LGFSKCPDFKRPKNIDEILGLVKKEKKDEYLTSKDKKKIQQLLKMKEKKGCGNEFTYLGRESYCGSKIRDDYGKVIVVLCSSCYSNQSPSNLKQRLKDKPEEKCSSKVASPPSGDNSNTKTLSDKIDKWFEDYNDMGEEWQIPEEEFSKLKNHVKDFIKDLKEGTNKKGFVKYILIKDLDKLAGERLI